MMKRVVLSLLVLCLIGGVVQSQESVTVPSARTAAIGGVHAALADDLTTLFSNPAGFVSAGPQLAIAELTIGLQGPIFDIANLGVQAASGTDLTALFATPEVQDLLQGLYASMNLLGPLSFGYVGKGLGLGFFNTTGITFANSSPLTMSVSLSEKIILKGGYSFRIPLPEESDHTLDVGVLLKGFLEGRSDFDRSFLQLPDLFSTFSLDTFANEPFRFITGIGFDLGVRYSWRDILTVGLAGIDVFSPTIINSYTTMNGFLQASETPTQSNGLVPFKLNAGVMYTPELAGTRKIISDLKVMLDYRDIFDFLVHPGTARNPLLHIGLGVEFRLLEILSIRAGLNEGLPAAGLGLDLHFFTLNAAMFGAELGSEPGMRSVYNIMIGFEFRYDRSGK
ncbi:MAG: hypothetical protein ACLFRY_02800 [Spirochaetia bacterium]